MAKGVQTDLTKAVVRRINELCKQKKWSYYKLAGEAGLSTGTLAAIMDGSTKKVQLHTIKAVCDAFEITLATFFSAAYFEHLPMD